MPGSGLYKIGIHPSGPAAGPDWPRDQSADAGLSRQLAEVARRFLPAFDPEPVYSERCVYDNSPDEGFIVDRVGNVVVGCGTTGHGFKFGPLFGRWLASLATGAGRDLPGGQFGLARFR